VPPSAFKAIILAKIISEKKMIWRWEIISYGKTFGYRKAEGICP
jgi:hypothetical protein